MSRKVLTNLDLVLNQLLNARLHQVSGNPSTLVESLFWYDSATKRPMFYDGTNVKNFGIDYQPGDGIDITNDIISVDFDDVATAAQGALADTALQPNDNISELNNDTGYIATSDLSTGFTNTSGTITVTDYDSLLKNAGIGTGTGNLAIKGGIYGPNTTYSTVIGDQAAASGEYTTAIGAYARVTAEHAIQIGKGTNSNAYTLGIGFNDGSGLNLDYTLLDGATGLIPDARLSSNIARTSDIPTVPTKISDLTDDTATYPVDKADTLTGLTATVTELNYTDGVTSNIQTQLNGKQATIDSSNKLLSDLVDDTNQTHKFATSAQLSQIDTNKNDITTINGKIPNQASSSNQLADKNFVNSSISTNTAYFDGTWDTYALVPTTVAGFTSLGLPEPTNNNYLVVKEDETQDGGTWRYKYVDDGTAYNKNKWHVEYEVNETPLTAAQLAALNSGITDTLVTQIGTNQSNISTLQTTVAGKQDTISDLSTIRSNASNGQTAYTTIQGYGNIVTHNASEFATASQGTKADTACQKITATNPALTQTGGVCTWNITNTLATADVQVTIREVSSNQEVVTDVTLTASTITIKMNSTNNIAAGTYKAVIIG